MPESSDGIILLAKQSGITSFSSLWQIKNALGTKKIGHTGTLDTFAEGLLVALSGRLTRLAPHVTNCDKEYEALVAFGSETDTLDPDGIAVRHSPFPVYADVVSALEKFTGAIMQSPPAYSAVHVSGQRASDLMRKGEDVTLPPRPVTIYSITSMYALSPDGEKITDGTYRYGERISHIALRVACSKGTYIRSLARDIAAATDSCAHLAALRRTRIGPFSLAAAAGASMLAPFGSVPPAVYGKGDKPPCVPAEDIRASVIGFTPAMSAVVGLPSVMLDTDRAKDFLCGKKPDISWFLPISNDLASTQGTFSSGRHTVFCAARFIGMIRIDGGHVFYEFVAGDAS